MSDKLRGHELPSFAAHCNKEGVQPINLWAERQWVSATDFSIGTPAVCGHTEEHFEVSRKQGSGYGRRNKWGITPLSP